MRDVSGETGRTTSRAASLSPEFRGCLRRNWPDHLLRGISEPRVGAGPPQVRAFRSPDLRGCLKRKGLDRLRSRHLRAHRWEDVSGAIGKTTSGQGMSEPRVARTSQARLAGPLRSGHLGELRGCLRRNGPDHLANGTSEPRVSRMSQAKRPIPANSETRQ